MAFLFKKRTEPTRRAAPPGAPGGGAADLLVVVDPAAAAPETGWRPLDAGRERELQALGEDMLERARGGKAGVFSSRFYSDKLMDWSMRDHNFKVQMFRFVDAFPTLTTPDMVHEHLRDYLGQPGVKLPPGMELGLRAGGVAKGLMTGTISSQIKGMAGKFIAGEDASAALPDLKKLWGRDIAFSVDLLGEACVSDAEADEYKAKYLDLVENLPGEVSSWPAKPMLETDHLGEAPRTNVSVKISSLSGRMSVADPEGAIADVMSRLEPILETARDRGVFINFDMEQFALKDLTLSLFERCCERIDFHAGLAMQAYLKSGPADAQRVIDWSRRTGRVVTVRLVKGAYWDYETIHAEEMGWPCPVWNEKWQTDRCFEAMSAQFLRATPRAAGEGGVKLALGSHNVRSIARTLIDMEELGLPKNAIELQMLHGMAEELKTAAQGMGLRVREYVPVGEMVPGMAYLVRRLLENTSNESWLKAGFLDQADTSVLLAAPGPRVEAPGYAAAPATAPDANGSPAVGGASVNGTSVNGAAHAAATGYSSDAQTTPLTGQAAAQSAKPDLYLIAPERHHLSHAVPGVGGAGGVGRPFMNEPMRDFADADQREAFARAVAGAQVPTVANDRTPEQASEMVARADAAFAAWRDADAIKRSHVLARAADAMRARRDEFSGVIIKENGKGWVDADADVCEAIDFCEYYAREAPGLFQRERLGRFIGELDEQWYQPRGVAAVISPWNFPLAIACGMTAAALVTGNTVILKPAEQTPGVAKILFDILARALREEFGGDHTDALQFCPAPGETTGAALVRDPRVALLAFTGSKAVGLDIIKAAGETGERQMHVKKVVCEMGGKNAVIIDTSADLDEAVLGVRHSAFGFQGQKCSAASRCIVVDPAGPDGPHTKLFLKRLVESARSLNVGSPLHPGTDVGPVIDQDAFGKINSMIQAGKDDGAELALALDPPSDDEIAQARAGGVVPDTYVGPHIFTGVEPGHRIAREEIFGPVLAVMHAPSFDEALRIANDHPYKLTGGVFSRRPEHLERAKREFRVGNLYLNRGITGALVARQPFGGFGMSGVGSKAGGRDYLLQFVEPRASCENTMRRGFAPEL